MPDNQSNNDMSIVRCYCSSCDTVTRHLSLFSVKETSDGDEYWWNCTYHIVRCLGCETICFYSKTYEESNIDFDSNGEEIIVPEENTYPFRKGTVHPLDSWYIPNEIGGILGKQSPHSIIIICDWQPQVSAL